MFRRKYVFIKISVSLTAISLTRMPPFHLFYCHPSLLPSKLAVGGQETGREHKLGSYLNYWPKGYSAHHAQELKKKKNINIYIICIKNPAGIVSQSCCHLDCLDIGLLAGDGERLPLYQLVFSFLIGFNCPYPRPKMFLFLFFLFFTRRRRIFFFFHPSL